MSDYLLMLKNLVVSVTMEYTKLFLYIFKCATIMQNKILAETVLSCKYQDMPSMASNSDNIL